MDETPKATAPSTPPVSPTEAPERELDRLRALVEKNAPAIALLGEWPPYISAETLIERVPKSGEGNAPGFDAGVACALGMIPEDRQALAAHLHANYSPESVAQVRREVAMKDPNTETAWWLAACSVCREGDVDAAAFLAQVESFKELSRDAQQRLAAATREYDDMMKRFTLIDGAPYGEDDGCMQAAYLAGYPFASSYAANYGLFFIGTYEESLGLEDFPWSEEKDEKGRAKSGPVYGSRQFVKCATKEEWEKALEVVRAKLPLPDIAPSHDVAA